MKSLLRVALLFALTPLALAQSSLVQIKPIVGGKLVREPTLVYDVTGSTIAGPVHRSLAVYNDGFATLSEYTLFSGGDGTTRTAMVAPKDVAKLTRKLIVAGAATLQDAAGLAADTPFTTVTFMKAGTDAKSHTFTFDVGNSGHNAVQTVVFEFIDGVFGPVTSITGGLNAFAAIGGPFTQEPVLVYDVTGSSFAGPVHSSYVVYNNGLVSVATRFLFAGGDGTSSTVLVDPHLVEVLRQDLAAAGAFALQDSFAIFPDVPVSTVTVMNGTTDSDAHTYSYTVGGAGHTAVSIVINTFLQDHVL